MYLLLNLDFLIYFAHNLLVDYVDMQHVLWYKMVRCISEQKARDAMLFVGFVENGRAKYITHVYFFK